MNQNQSSGMAVASMVLGIIGLVLSCCVPFLPFFLALISVILGIVSLAKKKGGKGMAIAGIICSVITLIPSIITIVMGGALMAELSSMM